jgi:ring-1,2-phenylacetyl-CoA epoxidase subunit PaaD
VSELGTQLAIARARAGVVAPADGVAPVTGVAPAATVAPAKVVDAARVRRRLASVMDPELPMVSIVDLGMIGDVEVSDTIRVALLPTYVGCPALELIERLVVEALADLGRPVSVAPTFDPPWTSERITPAGLAALAAVGIAPPVEPDEMRCPWCASAAVVSDSLFGPTQCRALWYCRTCRQPFEAIKPI